MRSGTWCFSHVPGLVRPDRRRRTCRLSACSRRSICRGLIWRNGASTARVRCRRVRARGTHSGSSAFRRTDHGDPGRAPQRAQRRHHRRAILPRAPTPPAARPDGPCEPPNQRLAVIPRHRHRFIQQRAARRPPCHHIPVSHLLQILLSGCWAHSGSSHLFLLSAGNPIYGAMKIPPVTLSMARYGGWRFMRGSCTLGQPLGTGLRMSGNLLNRITSHERRVTNDDAANP